MRSGDAEQQELQRLRFRGVSLLFGAPALHRLKRAHAAVLGIGGVGSWVVESLARSGIGGLTLVDLDEICISNTNRQLHTLANTVGRPKVDVMAERVRLINPECEVQTVQDFFVEETEGDILDSRPFDVVVDAIDGVANKCRLIYACRERQIPIVMSGGLGGKADPSMFREDDITRVHGPKLDAVWPILPWKLLLGSWVREAIEEGNSEIARDEMPDAMKRCAHLLPEPSVAAQVTKFLNRWVVKSESAGYSSFVNDAIKQVFEAIVAMDMDLSETFKMFDTDGDGTVDLKEAKQAQHDFPTPPRSSQIDRLLGQLFSTSVITTADSARMSIQDDFLGHFTMVYSATNNADLPRWVLDTLAQIGRLIVKVKAGPGAPDSTPHGGLAASKMLPGLNKCTADGAPLSHAKLVEISKILDVTQDGTLNYLDSFKAFRSFVIVDTETKEVIKSLRG
eukprot:Skav202199  [mRNA]  locus=scaffold2207:11391:28870:- [translate_table: standard]